MNMNIVISKRFISNLKFIYNYKKLSKYNLYGYALNKGIGPMSKEKIKTDSTYSELYQLLKKEQVLL
jgi:hypothetical protein